MRKLQFSSLLLLALAATGIVYYKGISLSSLMADKDAGKATFIPINSKHKPGRLNYASVQPLLESRCASCHAGFDAPCQLQLTSYEGLQRGASKQPLYETRLHAIPPSRLFIDGKSTEDWRKQGFFAVLNEKANFPELNLNNSLMAKLLVLKRNPPLPDNGNALDPDHSDDCPTLAEFADFQHTQPFAGMPYTLPNLNPSEQETLLNWLQDGAKNSLPPVLSEPALAEIGKWEQFLNDTTPAMQLTARYLYEHLFTGHLHIKDQAANEFYRLVRAKTPPGQAIEELDNLHPFTAPAIGQFYYRLRPVTETLADKTHAVYELSDGKMARLKALFLSPATTVAQLPDYATTPYAQPFSSFKDLPVAARYQFLLDDAHYFLSTMLKSPALNSQEGANGFRDQVWIAFWQPRTELNAQTNQFLSANAPFLRLPTASGESGGFAEWFELKSLQQQYLANKATFTETVLLNNQAIDLKQLWDGGGSNDNALLTLFRHNDNASVVKGLQGKTPDTAWVIDYPLFERLYYLLVADFNLYGDSAHHLNTRLTLSLLRSEAENNFLHFLPKAVRPAVHASWYPDLGNRWLGVFSTPDFANQSESAVSYQSQDYPHELLGKLPKIVAPLPIAAANPPALPAPCPQEPCTQASVPEPIVAVPVQPPLPDPQFDGFIVQLNALKGAEITALPEVSFLRITTATPDQDPVYTLIRNRYLSHVGVMFDDDQGWQADKDTLTVLPGLVGSYPNQFFKVASEQLPDFVNQLKQAQTDTAMAQFYNKYGVARNDPQFWASYDGFNQKHRDGRPENGGIFDLSRYGRR